MAEIIWKIGFDSAEAEAAGRKAGKASAKESSKASGKASGKGGAFAGGFVGAILGNLLASVKQLFDPLSAIASLLIAALFPILKPFLILFIKVGLLLYKWLSGSLAGLGSTGPGVSIDVETGQAKVNDSLKSALFIIGAIIAGIIAALAGAPLLIIGAIAVVAGLLVSQVGGYLIQKLLDFVNWLDDKLGTNFLKPLVRIFDGISNVFNGLWNTVKSLITLDWQGVKDGLLQMFNGAYDILAGSLELAWENLKNTFLVAWNSLKVILDELWDKIKSIVIISIETLKDVGIWVLDKLKSVLSNSFNSLRDIGSWISDKVKSFFSFGGFGSKSVNDAIITPNGDIIRTNPSDYLIATKTPGNLMGGSGGSKSVNVTINGGLITEDVARDIGRIIQREINYGGGF